MRCSFLPSWSCVLHVALVVLLVISPFALGTHGDDGGRREVCVVGGGAAGSAITLELLDRGYTNIRLIEPLPFIGGSCNTVYGPNGTWNEPGVAIFPDTLYANSVGLGPWKVDMVGWVKRFAGPDSILIPDFFTPLEALAYADDFNLRLFLGPAPIAPLTPDQELDFARLFQIMNTTYRWMETLEDVPNPIPPELLQSTQDFLIQFNLTSLIPLFLIELTDGGFGHLANLTAFDGLMQKTPTNLLYGTLGAWFSVEQGCRAVYDGMLTYFNSFGGVVMVNATVNQIRRPGRFDPLEAPVIVSGVQNGRHFIEVCDSVVLAMPQTLANLEPILDLTEEEYAIYSQISTRNYFVGTADIQTIPTGVPPIFDLANVNLTDVPFFVPDFPAALLLYRKFAEGRAALQGFATTPLTVAEMTATVIEPQLLGLIQSGALANITNIDVWKHDYNPHFSVEFLGEPVAPFNKVKAIQGHKRTYVLGAAFSTPDTMFIKNQAIDLVERFFPRRH